MDESTLRKKELEQMSFEEKLKLVSENDKSYLAGFMDRAVIAVKQQQEEAKRRKKT